MIHRLEFADLVRDALREDAPFGDPFGSSFPQRRKGFFVAGEAGIFCGGPVAVEAFSQADAGVAVSFAPEGRRVASGERVGEAEGAAAALLRVERVALNFIQRLSGIATMTARFVEAVAPYGTKVLDTRKTTPRLRVLEKYAVRVGGGANHRWSLSEGVLVKENAIRVAGGVAEAVAAALRCAPHLSQVEVEVETLDEAETAIAAGAGALLLDNMTPENVAEAVRRYGDSVSLEASGGIRIDNIVAYARTGVAAVSIGALTHSAPALDIAFEIA